MEFKEIKELIQAINDTDIAELELEQGDFKLAMRKNATHPVVTQPIPSVTMTSAAPDNSIEQRQSTPTPVASVESELDQGNYVEVTSPMVGTFYRAPSPDVKPFIQAGDRIEVGQSLCIIEAMKLMNEIESEYNGKIVKILVENAEPVEYGQPLFLVETAE